MSNYTTLLRNVVENQLDNIGLPKDEKNWPRLYNMLGLAGYPIYDETHRQALNDKIIRNYYFYEIGSETVAQFRWRMNNALQMIMPYYNHLYSLEVLDASHLIGEDYTDTLKVLEGITTDEKITANATGESSASGTTGDDYTGRRLDTPQARIVNIDDGWLTSAEKTNTSGTSESSAKTVNDTTRQRDEGKNRNMVEEKTGRRFDPSLYDQLLTIGSKLLNIDNMVVNSKEVRDCFMLIW